MRTHTVLIWVIVAGLLAGAVVLSRPSSAPSSDAPSTWTIQLDPIRATSLSKSIAGQPDETASRAPESPDAWSVSWTQDDTPQTWSADQGRIRAALRLLATSEVSLLEEDAVGDEAAAALTIRENDGRSVEIAFAERAMGGLIPIRVDLRSPDGLAERRVFGRIPVEVHNAFIRVPWSSWRDDSLFEPGITSVRALAITAGTRTVRLERGQAGWATTVPYIIGADTDEVTAALSSIHALVASAFEDNPPDATVTGLANPLAVITVERESSARTLTIGRQADPSGETVFASIATSDSEQIRVLRLRAEDLQEVTAAPEAYTRRTPFAIASPDIQGVTLASVEDRIALEATKQAGEWTSEGMPLSSTQRDAIDRLLRVLTVEPAAAVRYQPTQTNAPGRIATLRCFTPDRRAMPTRELRIATASDGALRLLIVQRLDGDHELVWVCASQEAAGVAAWAAAIIQRGT